MQWIAPTEKDNTTGSLETNLWKAADQFRANSGLKAQEHSAAVLGLIFLKYISDAFEELHAKLVAEKAQGADPEDPDEYRGAAHPVFWVPPEARWTYLKSMAPQPTIGSSSTTP